MAEKTRRVIFNNDGGDAAKPGVDLSDPMKFLDVRTTPLVGSHVDTISYCTSRGLGLFTHRTEVGNTVPVVGNEGKNALVQVLIEQGTDPLQATVEFGHAHGMEVFWSMRMNDTHDGTPKNHAMFSANRFKAENPECLLGSIEERETFRKWSAADYRHPKVRDLVVACVEEVCRNYDVDGIELDFFRHPVFFKETALGRPVGDSERETMTGLVRRIAEAVKREGAKRGRPFALAARTPDDVDYAATVGLEIERWMREGLIGLYIPSAYFRLKSWHSNVSLGHRHGVAVYPGLSESRVGGGHHADRWRSSDECYRARAANAWQAGADGIYLFNLFAPKRRVWSEVGDPETLSRLDKVYFASVRGVGRVAGGAYPHERFIQIPTLNPRAPLPLPQGGRQAVRIEMAERPGQPAPGQQPAMTLFLKLGAPENPEALLDRADGLLAVFNGHALSDAQAADGWLRFALEPAWARPGWNTVEVANLGEGGDLLLLDAMVAADHSGALLSDTSYMDRTKRNM